jgi:hypothetical protein
LEQAIARVRQLPEIEQDEAAEVLLTILSKRNEPEQLDDETRSAKGRSRPIAANS